MRKPPRARPALLPELRNRGARRRRDGRARAARGRSRARGADRRDGDGRDANPHDEGDWAGDNECGDGIPGFDSFFHGLFVSGLIGANADNGIGIAGMDWAASILPVRALARCGGTNADVFEGMLWASGVQIAGVPANQHPARVINMSLGGWGACSSAVQEAIDDALAQGAVVVVAAGNASIDVESFSPANCGGVITVGATGNTGERASYSNFGTRVDLSAPGGDGDDETSLIVSTYAYGSTTPGDPAYAIAAGTSFSAPLVSGTVSLMLARNPTLLGLDRLLEAQIQAAPLGKLVDQRNNLLLYGIVELNTLGGSVVETSEGLMLVIPVVLETGITCDLVTNLDHLVIKGVESFLLLEVPCGHSLPSGLTQ